MDENKKRRSDVIMQLRNSAWERITQRRTYEWRAAFTLWAAFGGFIAIALINADTFGHFSGCAVSIGVFIIGGILCFVHWRWLDGLGKATALDRRIAIHYEDILRGLSNSRFDKKLKQDTDEQVRKLVTLWRDWSRFIQWRVTFILYVTAVWVVILVSSN